MQILMFLYAGVNLITLIAYLPTLRDICIRKKASANAMSYLLWALSNCISLLYGLFILNDFLFIAVSGINFIACFVVFLLSVRLNYLNSIVHKEKSILS